MAGWVLKIIILILVIRALWYLLSGIFEGARDPARVPDHGVQMVRDPVCGTFVVRGRALTARDGDQTRYFCSEGCRKAFLTR